MKTKVPEYIVNPTLPITITVAGAGGSGSMFLQHLARVVYAYQVLTNRRVVVTVCDADKVDSANVGRQAFGTNEVGFSKADIMVSRINRFYGFQWLAIPENLKFKSKDNDNYAKFSSNFLITAVDNIASRREIQKFFNQARLIKNNPEYYPHFWINMGNTKTTGIVMVASHELGWPDIFTYENNFAPEDNEPSCTLAMALNKQDLFINSQCALVAAKWLWECLTQKEIDWRGAFINLETLTIRKLKVNAETQDSEPGQSTDKPAIKPAADRKRTKTVKNGKSKNSHRSR